MGAAGLLQNHIAAWICMAARYSSALSSAFRADAHTAGSRAPLEPPLPHYTSTAAGALLPCCILAAASLNTVALFVFARSCHIQPVSTGPWEIYAELPVWGEAITGAMTGRLMHSYLVGFMCMCVTVYNAAREKAWAPSGFAFEVKYQVNDEKISQRPKHRE